jgi:hypothetical protein
MRTESLITARAKRVPRVMERAVKTVMSEEVCRGRSPKRETRRRPIRRPIRSPRKAIPPLRRSSEIIKLQLASNRRAMPTPLDREDREKRIFLFPYPLNNSTDSRKKGPSGPFLITD